MHMAPSPQSPTQLNGKALMANLKLKEPVSPEVAKTPTSLHSSQSVYRERLLEHLLIGELLKHSWLHHGANLEVSQPSIDRSGHDVVLEDNGFTRHVQLKASSTSAKTATQKIHLGLGGKPSGCVIWVRFDEKTMKLGPFMFFGGGPGEALPSLADLKMAKHTKGDASGVKKLRPGLRLLPASKFRPIESIENLYHELFGTGVTSPEGKLISIHPQTGS